MTTATGDVVRDFTGLSNQNPYLPTSFAAIDGNGQILSGRFMDTDGGVDRFRYTGTVSADTIVSTVEVLESNTYFAYGPAILNSSGEGYVVRFTYRSFFQLYRVAIDGTLTAIGPGEVEYTGGLANGDRVHLELIVSTGAIRAWIESESDLLTTTDTTYSTGLSPGILFDSDGGGAGPGSWGGETSDTGGTLSATASFTSPAATMSASGSVGLTIAGTLTLTAPVVTMTASGTPLSKQIVTDTLRDADGALLTLTGIAWYWYDSTAPDFSSDTPTDSGTVDCTSGALGQLEVPNSTLTDGQSGTLVLVHVSEVGDPDHPITRQLAVNAAMNET